MAQLKTVNKASARILQEAMLAAMAGVEKKFGVSIRQKGGSIGHASMKLSFEVALLNADGEAQTEGASDYKLYHKQFGLPADGIGRTFTSRDKLFEITGLRPNAPKYPVTARLMGTSKTFIFPADQVVRKLDEAKGTTKMVNKGAFSKGQSVMAKYSVDGAWYEARYLGFRNGVHQVKFTDDNVLDATKFVKAI